MSSDWERWFDCYDDLDEARTDFERYLSERAVVREVMGA